MKIINQTRQPQTLADGTILAAANTPGAEREIAALDPQDEARLVKQGVVAVMEASVNAANNNSPSAVANADDKKAREK